MTKENTPTCTLPVEEQQAIAEALLGCALTDGTHAPCPGEACHGTPTGRRDFRLFFEAGRVPREHCFHQSCQAARTEFMQHLIRDIRAAEHGRAADPRAWRPKLPGNRPLKPSAQARPDITLNTDLVRRIADRCNCDITRELLRDISPVGIPRDAAEWPLLLLDRLYLPGEPILIFYEYKSQGQYIHVAGEPGYYKLAPQPGTKATRVSELPPRGRDGAWFLAAPVTGKWQPNEYSSKLGRRHAACCIRYPYAVLESDSLEESLWLRVLAQLHEPIAAIYTSGGRSIHALVRVDCRTKAEFDRRRLDLLRLGKVGADCAALSAVRLTRLPGIRRGAHMQDLLYLNPSAKGASIAESLLFI